MISVVEIKRLLFMYTFQDDNNIGQSGQIKSRAVDMMDTTEFN